MPKDLLAVDIETNQEATHPRDLFAPIDLFSKDFYESSRLSTPKPLEPTQVDVAMDSLVNRPGNVIDLFGKNQPELQPVSQDQITEGPAGPQPDAPLTKEPVFGDMPQAVSNQATNQLATAHGIKQPTVLEALKQAEQATGGLLEAGVTLATIPVGLVAGGATFAGGLLTPGESLADVSENARKAMSAFIAVPRSKAGQEIVAAAMYPVEWLAEKGDKLTKNIYDNGLNVVDPETGNTVNQFKGNSVAAAMLGSTPELLVYILPLLGRFNTKTLKGDIAKIDAVSMAEVVSEAANLRNIARTKGPQSPEYKAAFAEAINKRMPPDAPVSEQPPKPSPAAPEPQVVAMVPEVAKAAPSEISPVSAPVVVNARHWSAEKLSGEYDFKRLGQVTAGNNPQAVESAKLGAWFTDSETPISENLPVATEAQITMNNPLVLTNDSVPPVDVMGDQIQDAKQWLMDEVERAGGGEKLRAELQAKGHDGIIIEDSEFDNAKSYVVFGSDQVAVAKPDGVQPDETPSDPLDLFQDEPKITPEVGKVEGVQIEDAGKLTEKEFKALKKKYTGGFVGVEKKPTESKVTTLRGRILKMGKINFGNFKGELKESGMGVNKLNKKDGQHFDIAEQTLRDEGWLGPNENLVDVLRDPENLRRNKVAGEGVAKREQDKTPQEKQFEKEMNFQEEEPPPGDYIQMNAEDLPEGQKLTIIDDSAFGWDIYEVIDKDPFGITLKDGNTIQLNPGDKVQVRQEDIGARPSLVLQGERQMPKPIAEMRVKGKSQKGAEQGGIDFPAPETPETLVLQGERVGAKEALQAKKQGIRAAADRPPSGQASTGAFATQSAPDEPPGGQSYRDTDMPLVDMPELVEMAQLLGKGKMPQIAERMGKALGKFYPTGQGKIKLLASMFKDIKQATATLAHEIGHWVDYLPEKTMARGNILGRIASLKGYMKATMPKAPGALGEITPSDRKRLKDEAKKILSKPREIDEEITRIFQVTPEEILSIWNKATAGLHDNVDLYRYIAGLNTADKKSIIKEALKGLVPIELKRFQRMVVEKTGKKITVDAPASEAELIAKYNELIQAEIKKRELLSREAIMLELKELSRTWKPFDPQASRAFTKYRYSGAELYADAFSAMMVRPSLVKQLAPKFYDAWFAYLGNKPEVKSIYDAIIDRYRSGETEAHRVERLRTSLRENDQKYMQTVDSEWTMKDSLARELIDANHAILKEIHKIGERNIPSHLNPRYKLEDMAYSGSETEWLMVKVFRDAVRVLEKADLEWVDLGELLFHKRVSAPTDEFGGRSELANPLGWHKELSSSRLRSLMEHLTPKQREAIGKAAKGFREAHEYVIKKIGKSGRHPQEMIDKMMDAKNYATFDVAHYIDEKHGKGTGAKIFHQIGTLSEITNPATATLMKDIAMINSENRMAAKESVVQFYRTYFTDQVKRADRGKGGIVNESKDPDFRLIQYLKEGKLESWYLPKHAVEIFDQNPIAAWAITKILRVVTNPFRALFVDYNPGFFAVNVIRDVGRLKNNLPGAWTGNIIPLWTKSLAPAFKSVFGVPHGVVNEMLKGNMLISIADMQGFKPEDVQIEKMLKMYHLRPLVWHHKVVEPFGNFFNYLSNIGKALERTSKITTYKYLKNKFPDMPREVLAHIVRNSGSPDFLRVGRATPLINNFLLYSNVAKEGIRSDYGEAFGGLLPGKAGKGKYSKHPEMEWISKKLGRLILPKMLMFAAIAGVMGDDHRKVMNGVTEYDMSNYLIIPLGMTPEGKSVYMRIPVDESSRFIGGVFWKLINLDKHKAMGNLFDYTAGQAPAVSPALGAAVDVVQYGSGLNPYNYFTGERAIPEDVFKGGGLRSNKAMGEYLWGKLGGNIVYKFKHDDVDKVKGELETVLGYPIVSNIIGRYIKVTDAGVREKLRDSRNEVIERRTSENLDLKDSVNKILRGEQLEEADTQAIMTLAQREVMDKLLEGKPIPKNGYPLLERQIDRNLMVGLGRKYGTAFINEYMSATNAEERSAILQRYNEMQGAK